MGLRKGQTNNPAGKPAGRLNKMSKDLRLQVNDFLKEKFPEVIAEFDKLEGKDKARLYVDLLPYGLPRLQTTELKEIIPAARLLTKEEAKKFIQKIEDEC